jgi:hypothetical protein
MKKHGNLKQYKGKSMIMQEVKELLKEQKGKYMKIKKDKGKQKET